MKENSACCNRLMFSLRVLDNFPKGKVSTRSFNTLAYTHSLSPGRSGKWYQTHLLFGSMIFGNISYISGWCVWIFKYLSVVKRTCCCKVYQLLFYYSSHPEKCCIFKNSILLTWDEPIEFEVQHKANKVPTEGKNVSIFLHDYTRWCINRFLHVYLLESSSKFFFFQ